MEARLRFVMDVCTQEKFLPYSLTMGKIPEKNTVCLKFVI